MSELDQALAELIAALRKVLRLDKKVNWDGTKVCDAIAEMRRANNRYKKVRNRTIRVIREERRGDGCVRLIGDME